MNEIIVIKNDGPEITETNYFETANARRGALYLSVNAGAFRLLVPRSMEGEIREFETAREIVVSRGPRPDVGQRDAIEILFDDHTPTPYAVHIGANQVDRMPAASDAGREFDFSVWVDGPRCVLRSRCTYRAVKHLPWMKPR